MEELTEIWGVKENIGPLEIAARAFVMFFIALLLIRISGMRAFGKGTAFDNIISFLIGGVLSRGVIAATPFISTVVAGLVIVLIHRILSLITLDNKLIGTIVKGKKYLLYKDGNFIRQNLVRAGVSEDDVRDELRTDLQIDNLQEIEEINLERTGSISFIKKKKG